MLYSHDSSPAFCRTIEPAAGSGTGLEGAASRANTTRKVTAAKQHAGAKVRYALLRMRTGVVRHGCCCRSQLTCMGHLSSCLVGPYHAAAMT